VPLGESRGASSVQSVGHRPRMPAADAVAGRRGGRRWRDNAADSGAGIVHTHRIGVVVHRSDRLAHEQAGDSHILDASPKQPRDGRRTEGGRAARTATDLYGRQCLDGGRLAHALDDFGRTIRRSRPAPGRKADVDVAYPRKVGDACQRK
jgi:hypothetical protein